MDEPEKPIPSKEIQEFMDEHDLKWVLCGGLAVGMHVQPYVWNPRPKNEITSLEELAKRSIKLSDYAKRVYKVLDEWDSLGKDMQWRYDDLSHSIEELRKCYARRCD